MVKEILLFKESDKRTQLFKLEWLHNLEYSILRLRINDGIINYFILLKNAWKVSWSFQCNKWDATRKELLVSLVDLEILI